MEFRRHTLANGLEVIAECNPQAYSAAVSFFVNIGSRDESPQVAGVSHFLEHMVFKGTAKRSAEQVNLEFDSIGADYNAATSEERTIYYASLLPEYLPQAVELWADVLQPALREEDFETEKQVILEEIKMYQDAPPYGADDTCKELYFQQHPLASRVLGTEESISAMSAEQMKDYFYRKYSPANIALVGSGNIDFDQFVELAERYCSHWGGEKAERPCEEFRPTESRLKIEQNPHSVQEYLIQCAAAPPANGKDRYVAGLLSLILGDDSGSRFYWALVDAGLCDGASFGYHDYLDCAVYASYLSCAPEDCQTVLEKVETILREVQNQSITAEELQQAQNKVCSSLVLASERPKNRLFKVGANWTRRQEYRTVREELETIRSVSLQDIRRVLDEYPLTNWATVAVGPLAEVQFSL